MGNVPSLRRDGSGSERKAVFCLSGAGGRKQQEIPETGTGTAGGCGRNLKRKLKSRHFIFFIPAGMQGLQSCLHIFYIFLFHKILDFHADF